MIVVFVSTVLVLSVLGTVTAAPTTTSATGNAAAPSGGAPAQSTGGTLPSAGSTDGALASNSSGDARTTRRSAGQGENDTAVLWRGFRHAWSYNHRFNRFGSWVDLENCGGTDCEYEVGHSGASGTGEDLAAVRDAYTELSARNVSFASGSEPIDLTGNREDEAYDDSETVTIDLTNHPDLQDRDTYTVLLNGFDVRSTDTAAKVNEFALEVTSPTTGNGELTFDIEYTVTLDCDSVECAGAGAFNQKIDYEMDVYYLVVGGDGDDLNVVTGDRLSSSPDWNHCENNQIGGSSDAWNDGPDNTFPGNHMYCEGSGDREIHHEDYWQTDTIRGQSTYDGPEYSVGTVGVKSIDLDVDDEAHFTQYDTVVGGSYDPTGGTYDVRALPFFKEWSSRPGMKQSAKLALGHEGSAEVGVEPVLLQIRDGCKRSFVWGSSIEWQGGGAVPTTSAAVTSETYDFSFGDAWYGYGYGRGRGTYCEQPDDPQSGAWKQNQEVIGRTTTYVFVFPLRDGYPAGIGDRGDRVDLWNEFDPIEEDTWLQQPHLYTEKLVQDPTQLRGRPSDRFVSKGTSDTRPYANLSKIDVILRPENGSGNQLATETVDLSNGQSSYYDVDPDVHVNVGEDVVATEPQVLFEPGVENVSVRVENPVEKYEVEAYLYDSVTPDVRWLSVDSSATPDARSALAKWPRRYTLELLVYCPDESCQPVHAVVPFDIPFRIDPFSIGDYRETREISGSHTPGEVDYFEFSLDRAQRVSHARIRNGSGLELALLEEDGTVLQTADDGAVLDTTTTDFEGTYYLKISGEEFVDEYTLNFTTQRISQKYEENDRKAAAVDLGPSLGLDEPQVELERRYGSTEWCKPGGDGDVTTGDDGVGGPDLGLTRCPRHDWWKIKEYPAGYSPEDPDWYYVRLGEGQRIHVNLTDDRLGVELHHDGGIVASTPASAGNASLKHIADSDGRYYINVTGSEYVSAYRLSVQWIRADGQDRLEPNDEPATATELYPGAGNNTEEYVDLKLGGADDDYFAVELEPGDTLNATLAHRESAGTVELTLIDPDGNVTAATDRSFPSNIPEKRAELAADQPGTYYVRVSGSKRTALKYNLTIGTDKATSSASPGFGLAVALVALLIAALVARRRP